MDTDQPPTPLTIYDLWAFALSGTEGVGRRDALTRALRDIEHEAHHFSQFNAAEAAIERARKSIEQLYSRDASSDFTTARTAAERAQQQIERLWSRDVHSAFTAAQSDAARVQREIAQQWSAKAIHDFTVAQNALMHSAAARSAASVITDLQHEAPARTQQEVSPASPLEERQEEIVDRSVEGPDEAEASKSAGASTTEAPSSTPVTDLPGTHSDRPSPVVTGPSRTLEHVFWLILPASERETILGDAEESFYETAEKYGQASAQLDYFKELFYAIAARLLTFILRVAKPFKSQ